MSKQYQETLAQLVIAEFRKTHKVSDHMWKLYKYDCRANGGGKYWHRHRTRNELSDMLRWTFGPDLK